MEYQIELTEGASTELLMSVVLLQARAPATLEGASLDITVRFPEEVTPLLMGMSDGLGHLLGPNLIGVYVYGSILDAAFDLARSDVDCIVVTERALTELEFRKLQSWLQEALAANPWFERLQVSFLIKSSVLAEDKDACLLQFGILKRSGSDGNPIIWMDLFERGHTLRGAKPESFLPPVTPEIFHQALVREVGYLQHELCADSGDRWRDKPSYQSYAVLTICRILFSLRTGTVASKGRAAGWALDHLPAEWHDLIHQAVKGDEAKGVSVARLSEFLQYAYTKVRSTPPDSICVDR